MARTVDVVIVGAGHSGLAMSHSLARLGIEHLLLEAREVASAWRRDRWDSLRLLTPNWQTRLPGHAYTGDDPDGFMSAAEVAAFIEDYARQTAAPVRTHTRVLSIRASGSGFTVATDRGAWCCRAVVLANGAFAKPAVPAFAASLPNSIASLPSCHYRNPGQLEDGSVLVVGASSTGLQLAEELRASGRQVTLATGEHVRMPRSYRGRDIEWWLDAAGVLDERYTDVDDIERARRVPSPQLIGTPERRTLDLNALRAQGVDIVGRLAALHENRVLFSGSVRNVCALADLKLYRLLERFDDWASHAGLGASLEPASRPPPTEVDAKPRLGIRLDKERIRTVIWATGLRPDHTCVELPAFDRRGRLRHDGGIAAVPGLYVLGLPFMRRRKSSYLHGAADDARELGAHLAGYLRSLRMPFGQMPDFPGERMPFGSTASLMVS